jgi:hypothetical protein
MSSFRRRNVRLGLAACLVLPAVHAFGQVGVQVGSGGLGVQVGPLSAGVGPNQAGVPDRNGDWRGDATQNGQYFPGSAIVGVPATLQDGSNFGTVRDCIFSNGGCIEYAVVDYGNRLVPVPWGVGNFDFGRRAFRVGITRDRLRDLPTFTNISELNNAQFTQRVHSFYRGNQPMEKGQRRTANPNDARPQAGQPQPATRAGDAPHRTGEAVRGDQNRPASRPVQENREERGAK